MDNNDESKEELLDVFDQPDIEASPVPEMPDVDADATDRDMSDTQSPGGDFGDHSKDEGF